MRGDAAAAAIITGVDVAALVFTAPDAARLTDHLAAPHAWLEQVGVDRAAVDLAAGLLWLTAAWLAVGLLAAVAGRLPGVVGRLGSAVSRGLLPAGLHRLVAGTVGLGLVLAPAVASAHPAPSPGPGAASRPHAVPSPLWPTSPSRPTPPERHQQQQYVPAPRWPSGSARHHEQPQADRDRIRVRAGDSLWALAARRLGAGASDPQIARYWPRVYSANRAVIGDDPDLISPGQVLHVPAPTREGTP